MVVLVYMIYSEFLNVPLKTVSMSFLVYNIVYVCFFDM